MELHFCPQGLEKFRLGDLSQAIEVFDRAIQNKPYCAESYYWRGRAYFSLNQLHEAI